MTGEVTITNTEDDPWGTKVLLLMPDSVSRFDPEKDMLDIYTTMVIGYRAKERDFSDQEALERCRKDAWLAITWRLGANHCGIGRGDQALDCEEATETNARRDAGPWL